MTRQRTKNKIDHIEPTTDNLTSRAGLTPWVRYLDSINIYVLLDRYFGSIRKSSKGITVTEAFKQLLCFFLDGTDPHLTRFDHLAADSGVRCHHRDGPWRHGLIAPDETVPQGLLLLQELPVSPTVARSVCVAAADRET